jgi:3-dehydroquinate synthase
MPARAPRIQIRLRPARSFALRYPLRVGTHLLASLPAELPRILPAHRYFLITDRHVARLHGRRLLGALRRRGLDVRLLAVPAGERAKTRATKSRLEDRMIAAGAGRDAAILALGGGMITDLAGFTAATYLRGIPYLALPTTLLAMVDASIGGKTAVDHPAGKNLIGAFHHPRAVLADVGTLRTLPEREFRSGLAEAVKTAVAGDGPLFRRLERSRAAILSRHPAALTGLVLACCRVKAAIVRADEKESGRRAILNFGHTLGHALERASGYRLAHGEAVAIGMCAESRAAEAAGILRPGEAERIERLLLQIGLPVRAPAGLGAARLLAAARSDKKARRGSLRYAVPVRIGSMARGDGSYTLSIPAALIRRALRRAG